MLSWGAPVTLGKDELRRKRPIWMLILLMIATQGLYAPAWLALSWRELKRDVPDLSWNSLLHGAAWCPLVFATLWAPPRRAATSL